MRRHLALLAAAATLLAFGLAALAGAETIQRGGLRIAFDAKLTPNRLPREGSAPVAVSVATRIATATGADPPQLKKIAIAINGHGQLDATGLPRCEIDDVQPATSAKALAACRPALVGQGHFSAQVALDRQGTFPSEGKMLAFNGTYNGKPAILAHVYGTEPVPTSITLPFVISKAKGTFATVLTATLPSGGQQLRHRPRPDPLPSFRLRRQGSLFRLRRLSGAAGASRARSSPSPRPATASPTARSSPRR